MSLKRPTCPACERAAPILIQRLQQRDQSALAELYDLYGRLIYSLILQMVRDAGTAEDLVQETFLCVWRRVSLFESQRGALVPWLLTIGRNRAVDYLRSSNGRWSYRTLSVDEIDDPKLLIDVELNVSIPDKISLYDALQKLSETQRTIINLAYFEGYSQTEIAAKLGYPLGTVKTWARSALKTLRENLQKSFAMNGSATGQQPAAARLCSPKTYTNW
jgi:RNA polymerase sigma-70 factor (ECF subfamily)